MERHVKGWKGNGREEKDIDQQRNSAAAISGDTKGNGRDPTGTAMERQGCKKMCMAMAEKHKAKKRNGMERLYIERRCKGKALRLTEPNRKGKNIQQLTH